MIIQYLRYTGEFVFYLLLQTLILNNFSFGGWATPFLYIYFFLKLPSDFSRNTQLTIGFLMGFFLDLFSNTPGMNTLASVTTMFFRPYILDLFGTRDEQESFIPAFSSYGVGAFIRYALVLILINNMVLYAVQVFSFAHYGVVLLRALASAGMTFVLILLFETIKTTQR